MENPLRKPIKPALLGIALFALIVLPGESAAEPTPTPAPRSATMPTPTEPDVVLIIIDTLRADHIGAYGYDRDITPNLDAFARRSVRFEEAISSSSWTRSAVASILTDLTPYQHGITSEDDGQTLPSEVLTLAECAAQSGYQTAAVVASAHCRFGLERGFDRFVVESVAQADVVPPRGPEEVDITPILGN